MRVRSLLRFCQMRQPAMQPPMMAHTYIQVAEVSMTRAFPTSAYSSSAMVTLSPDSAGVISTWQDRREFSR